MKTNTLTLTASQVNHLDLVDRLFGPANETSVSREQMSTLAVEMYSSLNIMEEYQIPETQFKESFIDEFIRLVSSSLFRPTNLNEEISSLSNFSISFSDDLKPNIIKNEASKILKIENFNNKSHIVLNQEGLSDLQNSGKVTGGGGGSLSFMGIFSLGGTGGKVTESSSHWLQSNKSLSDQLIELNKEVKDEIEWMFEGEKIVPKSINVAKLVRSKFSQTLIFTRIRKQYYEAPFLRKLSMYTIRATAEKDEIEKIQDSIQANALSIQNIEHQIKFNNTNLQNSLNNLNKEVGSQIGNMQNSIQATNYNFQNSLNTLKNDLALQKRDIASGIWTISLNVNDKYGNPIRTFTSYFNKVFKVPPKVFYTIKTNHVVSNVALLYKIFNEQITTTFVRADIIFFGVSNIIEMQIEWIAFGQV